MTSLIRRNPNRRADVWSFSFRNRLPATPVESNVATKLGVDVIRHHDGYTVEASLPGFAADDIDVTVDDGALRIEATAQSDATHENSRYVVRERRGGKFYRSVRIPDGVDIDAATTSYKDGVLKIELPVQESASPKRLPIAA